MLVDCGLTGPVELSSFIKVEELPEGPSAALWHMRLDESHYLFKLITLMVNSQDLQQIMAEVREWKDISNHPNISPIYDTAWDQQTHQLVIISEFMDCLSVKEVLQPVSTRIPEQVTGAVMSQAMAGLAHLHSAIHRIHRNIKPSNILVNSKGEAKITDLGQSAKLEHTLDACHTMIASQVYMSPERIQGANYTSNCDVWALGIVLVEMITGKHPYHQEGIGLDRLDVVIDLIESSPPPVLVPEVHGVSSGAALFSAKCLVWEKERRPTSAQLMLEDAWLLSNRSPESFAGLASYLHMRRQSA